MGIQVFEHMAVTDLLIGDIVKLEKANGSLPSLADSAFQETMVKDKWKIQDTLYVQLVRPYIVWSQYTGNFEVNTEVYTVSDRMSHLMYTVRRGDTYWR